MDSSYNSPTTKPIYKSIQVIWYLLGLIEVLFALRFVLKLFGANPNAGFTNFIYKVSSPIVAPFSSVFNITPVQGNVFEWTTLLAMVVYWFLAVAIIRLFLMTKTVSTPEAAEKLSKE